MRILGCIVKSVMTFIALAVLVVLLSAALPDSPGMRRFVGALAIVVALGWVLLTIWWLPQRERFSYDPAGRRF